MIKSGTKTDVTNYRPISLLPQHSQNIGKIVSYQNKQFFKRQQHVKFESIRARMKLSTSLAGMELIEEITNATDNKNMQLVYLSILKSI